MQKLKQIRWDQSGLVAVIAQHDLTGEVRMLAWANREALEQTLQTGVAHFFSRSRQSLWRKGETSGNELFVQSVWLDCDGDAIVYMVDPKGPSCHTGSSSCFFERLDREGDQGGACMPTMSRLTSTLRERAGSEGDGSYTRRLLQGGSAKINEKIREEAEELCQALEAESSERVVSESADLLYHALVGLQLRDIDPELVIAQLRDRFGVSGLQEKASRGAS